MLDRIIAELLSVKDARPGTEVHLAEEDIFWVIRRCREVRGSVLVWGLGSGAPVKGRFNLASGAGVIDSWGYLWV